MTLPLVWRPEPRRDLLHLTGYNADRDPAAADRIGAAIEHTAERSLTTR